MGSNSHSSSIVLQLVVLKLKNTNSLKREIAM
jgi:hypothetical protein